MCLKYPLLCKSIKRRFGFWPSHFKAHSNCPGLMSGTFQQDSKAYEWDVHILKHILHFVFMTSNPTIKCSSDFGMASIMMGPCATEACI